MGRTDTRLHPEVWAPGYLEALGISVFCKGQAPWLEGLARFWALVDQCQLWLLLLGVTMKFTGGDGAGGATRWCRRVLRQAQIAAQIRPQQGSRELVG